MGTMTALATHLSHEVLDRGNGEPLRVRGEALVQLGLHGVLHCLWDGGALRKEELRDDRHILCLPSAYTVIEYTGGHEAKQGPAMQVYT